MPTSITVGKCRWLAGIAFIAASVSGLAPTYSSENDWFGMARLPVLDTFAQLLCARDFGAQSIT